MQTERELKLRCKLWVENRFEGRLVNISPKGVNGYPDSDLMIPGCPIVKIEFKRSEKSPMKPGQAAWGQWLISAGLHYWVIWNFQTFVSRCEDHWIDRGIHRGIVNSTVGRRNMADG